MSVSRLLNGFVAVLLGAMPLLAGAAPMCSALFGNGVQSHSPSGYVEMGYMSRVYGSGHTITAPRVDMVSDYQDQAGYCDGVRCTASGTAADPTTPAFLTNTGAAGPISLGYQESRSVAAGDYGNVSVGQEARLTFTSANATYRMGSLSTAYRSILEFQPGDYWINGSFSLDQVTLRRLTGGSGPVRLFVNGDVNITFNAQFAGFGDSQLLIYSTQNITIDSQQTMPGFLYAGGTVTTGFKTIVNGAVSGTVVRIGQESVVNYVPPSDLGVACDDKPVQTCYTDDFDRGTLGGDWAVTTRSGSFGVPRIVGNRLRLTDNNSYNANAATLLRLTPGAGNKIVATFKYYAYGGNGADGVVLAFSDASKTPQPGGFGGSLGYAQINGDSGFNGGWLGIALDEYGNFANPTENRNGGPGLRPEAISIRGSGSGTSGYAYLNGTAANLNPKIDQRGSTPGPGHSYRVTLDTTTPGKALLTVERDTGSGYTALVPTFDVLARSGQAALPENFYISLTGSTGGSNNNHDIDDFQVCANSFGTVTYPVDHYQLEYSDDALTCTPLPVTIRACANAACTIEYDEPTTVTLGPTNFWIGGNTVTFTGHAALQYRSPDVGTHTFSVSYSSEQTRPLSTLVCSTANCQVNFHDSGFLFDVPDMIANKPVEGISLQAVRLDETTQTCAPAFANVNKTLKFYATYASPGTGTQKVKVNGTDTNTVANGVTPDYAAQTSLTLAFDADAKAYLTVRYPDAGRMTLKASYEGTDATGESYLKMYGSDSFVSRPYGLCIEPATANASCTESTVQGCPAFPGVRSGDSFDLKIKAVAWSNDGQPLTAPALCSNDVTPNFTLDDIPLSVILNAPVGGAVTDETLGTQAYSHALGTSTTVSETLSDVGIYSITAKSNDYFGYTVEGTSAMLGRMIPAYLEVSGSGTLQPGCGVAYSYQGQPMAFATGKSPLLTVTGRNRQGQTTLNYDIGDFWRLSTPDRQDYVSVTGVASLDAEGRLLTEPASTAWDAVSNSSGDGARSYRRSGETLTYSQALQPTQDDEPFAAKAELTLTAASLTDQDGACYSSAEPGATCQPFDLPVDGSEVRLGRMFIGNAYGSELQPLDLPWRIERWTGTGFTTETEDACTAAVMGEPELSNPLGHLSLDDTSVSRVGDLSYSGLLRLTAPGRGHDGSVLAGFPDLPDWLRYNWNGSGLERAQGLATFGVYQGSKPLIFRRELYRN